MGAGMTSSDQTHVIVALDFSDAIMERIRAVSPKLKVDRHYPDVPDKVWGDAEILYTLRHFPNPEQAPRLRWIQMHTAGIDHAADHPIMHTQDVEVTTASGIHAVQITEYCLMMMMAFTYKLPLMLEYQHRAEWTRGQHKVFAPYHLRGQTLGIIGYGAVGRELGRAADALGMRVLAVKRDVMHPADHDSYHLPGTGDPEGSIPTRIYPPEALVSMVRECDFVVVIAPLTAKTRHLIDASVLAAMKKTAVLINVARGPVVDEAALISALAANQIAGAALDVFETEPLPTTSPLWARDNVIISPHVAGNAADYHDKTAALFIENLQRYLENRPLLNRIEHERGY
jgi:phosphoglycerate dehydrogenase-like enzyme